MSLSESHIEQNLIGLLKDQGYEYYYGPDIAPFSENPLRTGFDSVILEPVLRESIQRLNPDIPESARAEAMSLILRLGSSDIMTNNELFHTMMTDGVTVEYFRDGQTM